MSKRFLIKHVGNLGDQLFFVPPALFTLKRRYPDCHITFVTAWGFKEKERRWLASRSRAQRDIGWGKRNQDGFCIAAMMTNPHIDSLVHWHDTALSLEGTICHEADRSFPTWNATYYNQQKQSRAYDGVFELDFGLTIDDNPVKRVYEVMGFPEEDYSWYQLYLTEHDRAVAEYIIHDYPRPRIIVLESLAGTTTRGWDPGKIPVLTAALKKEYGVDPIWFGSRYVPWYHGRRLSLRENAALLTYCDIAIGVMSGSLHMAAGVGLPTLTLYADQPIHRAAPAYFLNRYISDPKKRHRTLLGPSDDPMRLLKGEVASPHLTPAEQGSQEYEGWEHPGRQSTKSGLAVITVDEVMQVVHDMLYL